MVFNFIIILVAAIIPMIIGFVWYNPKVLGNAWMQAAGLTMKDLEGANMAKIFILAFIFSLFLAMSLNQIVIHQNDFFSSIIDEPGLTEAGSEMHTYAKSYTDRFGANFRTFKHGALHGFLFGLFAVLPVLGTNALFERKSFKYIAINVGYWTVCAMLMGGVICQFS